MAFTYTTFVSTISTMLVVPTTDPNFQTILPQIIADAENRCYRELDLLSTVVRDQSGSLTANSRNFTFPQQFLVSESINVFTPVNTTTNRNQLVPVTQEFLDAIWPNEASTTTPSVPQYYAMITDQTIIVGPSPDANYTVEVTGTIIPAPLSSTNTQTWLYSNLPDLFISSAAVFGFGYLQDFGQVSDNPQAPVTWESHFQQLLRSADKTEMRKKYAAQAWTAKNPSAVSTPPRV